MKLCLALQHQGQWEWVCGGARWANEPGRSNEEKGACSPPTSFNSAAHLCVFIQSSFCPCRTLAGRHQTFPSLLLHDSTLVSIYLNSSLTCLVYLASVKYYLLCPRALVQLHVSVPQAAFGM